jgi:hypothetical protein
VEQVPKLEQTKQEEHKKRAGHQKNREKGENRQTEPIKLLKFTQQSEKAIYRLGENIYK